jgi:hypothetical protein
MRKDSALYDEIARVAYSIYEKRGYRHGSDLQDWVEAERLVMKKSSKNMESESKSSKPRQSKPLSRSKSDSAGLSH